MKVRNKKRGGNPYQKVTTSESALSLNKRVMDIIQFTLGFVELFFERGACDAKPRTYQAT